MADDDGAACEVLQAFLQGTERVHVDVVGRLVEEEHVGFLLQGQGKVHTISFTARQHTGFLLLVVAAEVEAGDVGARVHAAFA